MSLELVSKLRQRACPAGKPWTKTDPKADHGHADCLLLHKAADTIERLLSTIDGIQVERDLWEREARRG